MAIISALRRILNDTPATATNIDYNFQVLEDYINTEVVTTDGSNAISGPLVVGPPVADTHAATKGYVDGLWFTGMTVEFAGDTLPVNMAGEWDFCNGTTQSTTDPKYQALFAVIDYRFGGSGGNFKLPDYRGRVSIGKSNLGTDAIFDTSGKMGGQRDGELLSHAHTAGSGTVSADHSHAISFMSGASDRSLAHAHSVGSLGMAGAGGHSHGWAGISVWHNNRAGGLGGLAAGGNMGADLFPTEGNHAHTMVGNTGGEGAPDHLHAINGQTQGISANHTHTITVNANGAGTTLTDKNLPPYVVVNRIIKL